MPRSKPPLVSLHELAPDQYADSFALLADKVKGATRDNKPYFTCRFRDARRSVTVMVWADSPRYAECEREWQPGHFYKLRGHYVEHERYGPQFDLEIIRPATDADRADGFDPGQLVERSRHDPAALFADLYGLVERNIADAPLRKLVLSLLDRHSVALQWLPGSQGRYYPFVGGLLEHTLSVAQTCVYLAERYAARYPELRPPLNKDVVIAGAVLHDFGRVLELQEEGAAPQQTVAGRLFGHIALARDLVRDAAREQGDIHPELVRLVEHVVLTHLALPEWGSPRLPLIPEAIIVHHADDLDAKVEMYARCLTNDTAPGPFTDRDPSLGRQLYKGREV